MSFPRYPEYKDSGVEWLGQIPCDWDVTRVKAASHVIPSNVDKHSKADEEPVQLCNYTDVYYHDLINPHMKFMSATASQAEVARFALAPGDVVITKDSETADDIAVPAFVAESLPGVICGYHLAIIRPYQDTYGRYLHYLFHARYLRSYFEVQAKGLTRVGISQSALGNAPIPSPQFEEQRAIADFLDHETAKSDALIEEQQRLIELLEEKRQAVISHAVTKGLDPEVPMKYSGVEWLGEVPVAWAVGQLRNALYSLSNGTTESQAKKSEVSVPVSRIETISSGVIDYQRTGAVIVSDITKRFMLEKGDILFSHINSLPMIGNCAIYDGKRPLCHGMNLLRLRPNDRVDPAWLAYWLKSRLVRQWMEASAKPAINQASISTSTVKSCPTLIPSVDEQRRITRYLDHVLAHLRELEELSRRAIIILKERRSALISAAVTGKIDVRNWQSETDAAKPLPMAAEAPATYEAREQ